jgi:hypothetical protein
MTQELDAERRKLHFRSCHRGIKEMDIIFGKFAETVLGELPDEALWPIISASLNCRMTSCSAGRPVVRPCPRKCARPCSTVC